MRADDDESFARAFDRLRRLLRTPDVAASATSAHEHVLVEGFIPGREFAIEGVLTDGALQVLAIFDKPDPLDGPFFEETIYVTPSRASVETQEAIVERGRCGDPDLGLRHGPVHAECRVNAEGSSCSKWPRVRSAGCVRRRFGSLQWTDAWPLSKNCCCGTRLESASTVPREQSCDRRDDDSDSASRDLSRSKRSRRGRDVSRYRRVIITAKPDSTLVPLPEGRSYLGFIFATSDAPASVEEALRCAHDSLEFSIDREVTVAQ